MIYIISKEDLSIKDALQESSFEIEQDIDLSGKSSFSVARLPVAREGDFLIINEYKGLITNIETTKDSQTFKIHTNEIDDIFNRKIILASESLISSTGMEDFIAQAIYDNFTNSTDTFINISYLNITVATHTPLNTSVSASVGVEDGIYDFKTFLGNVKEKYDICLDYEFNGGTLDVTISKKTLATVEVDATIEDVVEYDEVYSVEVVSKVTVLSKATSTQFNYYLKTDRTVTTNAGDPERAAGKIEVVTCEEDSEAYQTALDVFKSNSYRHNIDMVLIKGSKIYSESDMMVGRPLKIKTKDNGIYETFISSKISESDSNLYRIECGNMRVTLINKLKGVI